MQLEFWQFIIAVGVASAVQLVALIGAYYGLKWEAGPAPTGIEHRPLSTAHAGRSCGNWPTRI